MRIFALAKYPIGDYRDAAMLGVAVVATFLALFFSATSGLLVITGAWLAWGTWRKPWPAFLILMAVVPFLLIIKATHVLGSWTLLKDVVLITLTLRALRERTLARLPLPVFVPVLVMVGWSMVAFARADVLTVGMLRLRDLLLYLPAVLIVRNLVTTRERARQFLATMLGTALLVLVLGVVQWVAFSDSMVLRHDAARSVWVPRLSSVLAHPNHLGGYLLLLVPLAVGAVSTAGVAVKLKWLAAVVALAGVIGALATYSRSVWVALPVALLAYAFLWGLRARPRLVLGGAFVIALGVTLLGFVPSVQQRLRAFANPAYQSNRTRLEIVVGSLALISRAGAIIGEGLGDTKTLLGRTADISVYEIVAASAESARVVKGQTFVDNAVVKTWVEQGVVGLVVLGWVAVRLFVAALRSRSRYPEQAAIARAFTATMLGLAVFFWFLDVPDMFPLNLYFWTLAGLSLPPTAGSDAGVSV